MFLAEYFGCGANASNSGATLEPTGLLMFRKPGEVVAVTAKVGGKRWWVEPMMVVKDTAVCSVLYIAPGATYLMPDRLAELSRPERGRVSWDVRSSGRWNLLEQTWQTTHALTFLYPGKYYAIRIFWTEAEWRHLCWYVNFQRPYQRTPEGFETLDLALDLLVSPTDVNATLLKDEDEYRAGIACGQITPDDVAGIERDRVALADLGASKLEAFESKWLDWRPEGELPALTIVS